MKKHSLFKIMMILLLLVVIVTYLVVGRDGSIVYLGLGDVVGNFLDSFYYFFDTLVFILMVGGFYGVLNKTGAYKKLLDKIVIKFKPYGEKFIFAIIIIFALVASLTGITLPLIVFIPFVISIILLMGYDKLVAISSTVVSILVGFIGGIFVTFRDPSYYYGYSGITFEEFVGLDSIYSNIFPKILLLILGIGLLIFFVYKHISNVEKKKVKYELKDNTDVLITEVKGNYKDIKTWPLITILSAIMLLLVLGLVPWETLFNTTFFSDLHTTVFGLTIGNILTRLCIAIVIFGVVQLVTYLISLIRKDKFKFRILLPIAIAVFALLVLEVLNVAMVFNIYDVSFIEAINTYLSGNNFFDFTLITSSISSSFVAFGSWASLGNYKMIVITLIVFALIIKFAYKIKFDDVADSFVDGMKKMLPAGVMMILAYAVLVCAYNNGFIETIITNASEKFEGISIVMGSLITMLGSLLNVDLYYTAAGVFSPIVSAITDETLLSVMAIAFQSLYGLVMIIGPTSLLLIMALTYLDVPYTTWVKYIWRLVLELFILIFVILLIVSLI